MLQSDKIYYKVTTRWLQVCDDGVGSLSGKWMLGDDQLATQCASAVAAPDSPSSSLISESKYCHFM